MHRSLPIAPFLTAFLFASTLMASVSFAGEAGEPLGWAKENLAAGKYTEAEALLTKALDETKDPAARRDLLLAQIEVLRILGKLKEAHAFCDELLTLNDKDAVAQSLKAELDFETGNYRAARERWDRLIAADRNNARAWALRARVLDLLSDSSALKETSDYFFNLYQSKADYFNSEEVKDPLELAYIGLGFKYENPKDAFEVGFLLAESLAKKRGVVEPEIWLWSAELAQEKYNFAFAEERYKQLAKLRPNDPDALAGLANIIYQTRHDLNECEKLLKEALKVNPNHVESNLLYAVIHLSEDRFEDGRKYVDTALAQNPNSIHALAMQYFYFFDTEQMDKAAEIEKRVLAMNPKCADFYCEIGEAMETKRGFNTAPEYYQKAIDVDKDNWRGYYCMGMNTSRQGAHGEEKGKELLEIAFRKNRFNLWARNMLTSLDKLIGDKQQDVKPTYVERRTKHFIIKSHAKDDPIVGPYLDIWAEAAYERQKKMFGYEPEGPLTIELCHSFQDQAARTVGLPNLGALGVCFGKLCTVVSPREGMNGSYPPFNWRKVLDHEYAHVMALQLSKFRVPRWYTEALSTLVEDDSRIQTDRMMVDAISRGELKDIDKINEYFRGNMIMAYVHGRYVLEYLAKNFGFEFHVKALKAFAEGRKLDVVLPEVSGKTMKELNDGQLQFVKDSFKDVRLRPSLALPDLVAIEAAAKAEGANAAALTEFAIANLMQRKNSLAEEYAKKALEKDPKWVDALNVLGSLAFDKRDFEGAKQFYMQSTAIDGDRSFTAWHRLGVIYKKEGRTTKAIEAFEKARANYPRYVGPDNPHHELPELYEEMEPPQMEKSLSVWRDAVKINTEDKEAALNGLKLAMKLKDYKSATEFAMTHIEIDPYVPEVHVKAGRAFAALGDFNSAAREFQVAAALNDKDVDSFVGLARARKELGETDAALKAVEAALEIDGTHAEAKALRDQLNNGK
jgi:cellulose synthase operon protein C